MTTRLGQLLLKEEQLTPAQLEEALQNQVIFGGKLGTNLVEMGLLAEGDLARFLSKKMRVPVADPQALMSAPRDVIDLIPGKLAAKHKVVPLSREKRRLVLAMADPADLQAIDEIAFQTGFVIRPVLATELRIVQALETHYGIERQRRYIRTDKEPSPAGAPSAAEAPSPTELASADTWFEALEDIEELTEVVEIEPEAPSDSAALASNLLATESGKRFTMDSISKTLAEAEDREDIAEAVSSYLGQEFPHSALFLARDGFALGWKGMSGGAPIDDLAHLQVPLDEPSILQTVSESQSYYLGPLQRSPFNSMLLQCLGDSVPESALALPLRLKNRLVALIYVDGPNLDQRLFEVQKLTAKATMAFEILILKNKMLAM